MHLHPSWMIFWCRCFSVAHSLNSTLVIYLLVAPYPVRPHVCAVEIGFGGIEHHAVDGGLVAVLKVLDVFLHATRRIDREDVAIASVVIKGVTIYGVRRLLRRKQENGSSFGIDIVRFGCASLSIASNHEDARKLTMSAQRKAPSMHDLARSLDFVGTPFLHGRPVDVLPLVLQGYLSILVLLVFNCQAAHTSKAIQLMGSSSGISVFFTNSSSNVSSSNETVIITPGGVHVPIIR
jgi:hypothetical protein